ncbi:hypothetical protein N431DRAFT_430667 [Stipitochalara longipes BDJ]|nr:hypothetical protein N431DRAFT_430667 [Stipitochalara longipes BDJ]
MDPTLVSPETYITTTFATLLQPFNPSPASVQKWSNLLLSTYSEPHRHYHTTAHIYSMLQHFSSCLPQITNPTVVGLAIIFHDWEYLPHSPPGWSEEQSIVHFGVFAEEIHLPSDLVETVKRYITATISHKLPPEDEDDGDLKLFLDFDLEVLSRERKDYVRYTKQIRKEYGQFDDQLFCWGRKDFLEKYLGRERLFLSDVFFERCEERAKENLKWETGGLKGGDGWGIMGKLRGDGGVEK